MEEFSSQGNNLQQELAYYKKQLDRISGESIRNDLALSSLRHQLNQKKDALNILTILQKEFSGTLSLEEIFAYTVKAIAVQLKMDRSVILIPSGSSGTFKVIYSYGYPQERLHELHKEELNLKALKFLLLNKSMQPDEQSKKIQAALSLNYFAGVPLSTDETSVAFIITGRQFEKFPFISPLDKGDVDTLSAISGLINTVVQNRKMAELKLQKEEAEKQKEAIKAQRDILEETLTELKHTQAKLIQSEKMASLGELTAGIAHEIQNPLNFVNNFSDVNKELLVEMKDEMDKGNMDDAKEIADDIISNEEKINHHGKRAEAIVKGMLQHSRSSTAVKESTDINALADEYLRLAYHGLRAKDKSFNATMKTDFDKSIGKINIIPQDIGRVLLNLYNNAFYAVNEKKKTSIEGYEPTVSVTTKKAGNKVIISVEDNGNGIPQKIADKIFQPFFTTKPTGQGTGLGLSLSYDIVKAHGGEISAGSWGNLESKEGEGTAMIIQLPA